MSCRRGKVEVGSCAHQALEQIARGHGMPEGMRRQVLTALLDAGFVKETLRVTKKGEEALANAFQPQRRSRAPEDFGLTLARSSWLAPLVERFEIPEDVNGWRVG